MTGVAAVPRTTGEADQVRYAGFWLRLQAGVIDFVVFLPLYAVGFWALEAGWKADLALTVIGQAAFLAYSVVGHARWGQTVGKHVVGIRVLDVSGRRIGWPQSFRRSSVDIALATLSVIGYVVTLSRIPDSELAAIPWPELEQRYRALRPWWDAAVDYAAFAWVSSEIVSVLFNRRRRALHDFIAGTVVVVERRPATARGR